MNPNLLCLGSFFKLLEQHRFNTVLTESLADGLAFGCVSKRGLRVCLWGVPVADAFELAIELGSGVVRVAVFVLLLGFGLALFECVMEVGLDDGLE